MKKHAYLTPVLAALVLATVTGCDDASRDDAASRNDTTNGGAAVSSAVSAGDTNTSSGPAGGPDSDATTPIVTERYLTPRDRGANVDSVAVWHGDGDRHWLIATAKDTDQLIVLDAATGDELRSVGAPGDAPGQFRRPNGISVVDDLVFVVERDNRRVQVLQLPTFAPVGSFGRDELQRPYGLWVMPVDEGYRLYITDAYETADEEVPPHDQLGRRLHLYDVQVDAGRVRAKWRRAGGVTEGPGVLREVESLWGDAANGHLLVSDEASDRLNVKVYDLDLGFTGRIIGDGLFEHQPEGIALYACEDGSGAWLVADQYDTVNTFRAFERGSLAALGGFEGAQVLNTDGVWLTREPMPGFPGGAL